MTLRLSSLPAPPAPLSDPYSLLFATPVESRTTSSGLTTISAGKCFPLSAIRSSSTCAPRLPISVNGWRTVVSDGVA